MSENDINVMWIAIGAKCYRAMKEGRYATVAHAIKQAMALGIYEESSSWRTAILLNYRIGEDI